MATVTSLKIERGSLLVFNDVEIEPDVMADLVAGLARVVGHQDFLVFWTHGQDGEVEVVGPADVEAFIAKLNITPEPEGDTPDGKST